MAFFNAICERPWNLRRDAGMRLALLLLLLALGGQVAFWNETRDMMPEMSVVADVPGDRTVRALSFGDEEAFFRLLALNIQNSGDTFGRFTPLYKYDYGKLYHWFRLLNGLNHESNYLAGMATYYFSQTQNPNDVHYIVDYLEEFTAGRPKEKWWWVVQASYLANHKLHDEARALKLANQLRGLQGIPVWAQQMAAFIYEKRGEYGEALAIIEEVIKNKDDYNLSELKFMSYFVRERLGKLDAVRKQLDDIAAEKQAAADKAKAEGRALAEPYNGPPPDVGVPSGMKRELR
jgi:tetratricopeptide (TPR) repeat protein